MHTYIFSVLPIIQLYFQNCLEFNLGHILGVIGIFCLLNALLYHGLSLFLKKHRSAIAILVSMWWIAFWFTIPVARYIFGFVKLPGIIAPYKALIALIILLVGLGIASMLLLRCKNFCDSIHKGFNIFGFIAMLSVLFSGLYSFQKIENTSLTKSTLVSSEQARPNVYHILLDAYTNYNILKEEYGYDNVSFYQALESLGFLCFPSSRSNYPRTIYSVPSMLNFGLVHEEAYEYPYVSRETTLALLKKVQNNTVWKCFSDNGYHLTLLDHTGVYASNSIVKSQLSQDNFTKDILNLTSNTILKNFITSFLINDYYLSHINIINQILNKTKNVPQETGLTNQYTYAHIISPHEPYVFDEQGAVAKAKTLAGFLIQANRFQNPTSEQSKWFKDSYVNQVKALNNLVLPVIESILKQHAGSQSPIIILHADHGWLNSDQEDPFNSLGNLFAIYVPPEWREEAKTLEFINLYRFICNHLFGMSYPYQESQYFYSEKY